MDQLIGGGKPGGANPGAPVGDLVKDTNTASFRADVLDAHPCPPTPPGERAMDNSIVLFLLRAIHVVGVVMAGGVACIVAGL